MRQRAGTIQQTLQSAIRYFQAGKLEQAGRLCLQILEVAPDHAEVNHLLGVINCQIGRLDTGLSYIRKAIKKKPDDIEAHKNLGKALKLKGNLEEAAASYREVLALAPDYAEVHNDLGNIFQELEKLQEAEVSYQQAIASRPDVAGFHNNLATVLKKQGKFEEAVAVYKKALRLNPDYAVAHNNLGNIYGELGSFKEAEDCYRKAVSCHSRFAGAYNNLGNILVEQGRYRDSLPMYQKAISLEPAYAEAFSNLGKALLYTGAVNEAEASCQKALALKPDLVEAHYNLGNVLKMRGCLGEAIASYRKALAIKPDYTMAHSSLLFSLNYRDTVSPEDIYRESLDFDRQHAEKFLSTIKTYGNSREKDRILRIGYVSPDFRDHSVAYFFEPVLKAHDRTKVEVFCYANVKKPDNVTRRLRAEADHWVSIVGHKEEAVAARIKEDTIDILVDLAGHTGDNKLLVFAHGPAPVQVSWLGYPNTTGMQAIAYRLTDAIADPVGKADNLHTEELIRLEYGFLCYQADGSAPDVSPLPALNQGFVTFGSFNNLAKVTDEVVQCWANILQAVPDSHLLIKSKPLADDETKAGFLQKFTEKGIAPERLELIGWLQEREGHLGLYGKVDIGLDPFPYNGTTTTCEALWMGVPVVTLLGDRHAGRVGASIMHQVGLEDLVVKSAEDYVKAAQALANDRESLQEMRGLLRTFMQESPLMDSRSFVKDMENEYRRMWHKWCNGIQ